MATNRDAIPMEDERAIIIKTDATLGTIDDNFDELKVAVARKVMKYQGLVFSDEEIKDAKSTKAELKKMIDTLEDNRKAIKKKWNDPYFAFEAKVKEVIALIEKPMNDIDAQIQDFEERRKIRKEADVRALKDRLLSSVGEEYQEFVRGCGIEWDERWLNATMTMNKITEDIQGQINHIMADVSSIQDICEGDEMLPEILAAYQDTKDLAGSLQKRKSILAQRENIRRMQEAKEARERAAAEAEIDRQRMLAEEARLRKELEEAPLVIDAFQTPVIEDLDTDYGVFDDEDPASEEDGNIKDSAQKRHPSLFSVVFSVEADLETMGKLVAFMNNNGISFRRISQEKIA